MLTRDQAKEILEALQSLPADKVEAVYDYVTFLRQRYGENQRIDKSDTWSEEDISDLVGASLAHAQEAAWDRQIEADVDAGRLDQFADQAIADLREGRAKDL
jgi:hypothetical protein